MRRKTPHRRIEPLVVTRLWALQIAFQARLEREVGRLGLTTAGFRLVGELMNAPAGLKQRELAERLGVKAPTVSVAITRLEADGVVERVEVPEDPRAWRVRLTRHAPLGPGIEVLETLEHELVGGLASIDRRALITLLERVTTRLTAEAP